MIACSYPACQVRDARIMVDAEESYCAKHARTRATALVRSYVMERDRYTCQRCRGHATDWHHILTRGAHPALRLEPSNGVALCRPCHGWAHDQPAALKVWVEERQPGILTALMRREAELERSGAVDLGALIRRLRVPELTAADRARYEDGSWLG